MMPLTLVIDGQSANAAEVYDDLPRAVLISLFTWRRANPDDELPSGDKFGWWGDSFPPEDNDRIGSRLWLLLRSKLTVETISRAKEYAEEALQWLIDDGAAAAVQVVTERQALDRLAMGVTIIRGDKTKLNIRFASLWDYLDPSALPIAKKPLIDSTDIAGDFLIDSAGVLIIDYVGDAITHL